MMAVEVGVVAGFVWTVVQLEHRHRHRHRPGDSGTVRHCGSRRCFARVSVVVLSMFERSLEEQANASKCEQ